MTDTTHDKNGEITLQHLALIILIAGVNIAAVTSILITMFQPGI